MNIPGWVDLRPTLPVLVVCVALSACATAYQPVGPMGGYDELQLAPDIHRVTFRGNGYTRPDRVVDFTLLRAAEICLQNGAKQFVVLNEGRDVSSRVGGTQTTGTLTPRVGGGYSFAGTTSPPVVVTRHRAELVIQLLRDQPPLGTVAYSAELIRDQVRQKYGLAP